MVHDRIQIQIGLAVQVLDALTGQPVDAAEQNMKVRLEPGKAPVRRKNGYYLFLQPLEPEAVLSVHAAGYQERELKLGQEAAAGKIQKIYLKPDKQYPMSAGIYGMYGTAKPGEVFGVTYNQRCRMGRLGKDYHAGETDISIYTRGTMAETSKEFQIREQESSLEPSISPEQESSSESSISPEENSGLKQEFLKLYPENELSSGEYALETPLQHSYHKNLAELYPVIWLKADERGDFFCYWKRMREDKTVLSCDLWTPEGEWLHHIEIPAGKRQKAEI